MQIEYEIGTVPDKRRLAYGVKMLDFKVKHYLPGLEFFGIAAETGQTPMSQSPLLTPLYPNILPPLFFMFGPTE